MNKERDALVKAILAKPTQPQLEDAVALMKFELKSVAKLFEVHEALRKAWIDKRLG